MSFIGDTIGQITRPILGKPDRNMQEKTQEATLSATNAQNALAGQLINELAPLRNQVIQRSTDFMKGNFDPTASAMFAPMKANAEQQFNTAENNLMERLPQGGALFQGMADLQGQKAQSLSSLIAQIVADEYQKAFGMGSGAPQVAGSLFAGGGQTGIGMNNGLAAQLAAGNSVLNSLIGGGSNIASTLLK